VQEVVAEGEGRLPLLRKIALGVVVVDLSSEILGETRLTGERETDVASIAAVGDAGVTESYDLLELLVEATVAPEGSVQLEERLAGARSCGEESAA
jgi:hypothetical protein